MGEKFFIVKIICFQSFLHHIVVFVKIMLFVWFDFITNFIEIALCKLKVQKIFLLCKKQKVNVCYLCWELEKESRLKKRVQNKKIKEGIFCKFSN